MLFCSYQVDVAEANCFTLIHKQNTRISPVAIYGCLPTIYIYIYIYIGYRLEGPKLRLSGGIPSSTYTPSWHGQGLFYLWDLRSSAMLRSVEW
jgi:hypothetical protein